MPLCQESLINDLQSDIYTSIGQSKQSKYDFVACTTVRDDRLFFTNLCQPSLLERKPVEMNATAACILVFIIPYYVIAVYHTLINHHRLFALYFFSNYSERYTGILMKY